MPEKVDAKVDEFVKLPVNPSEICFRAFELMQQKLNDEADRLLNSNMGKVDDNVSIGLFHSALGVLYKLKGEAKTAWKHYQRAEKLIPEDPALKIITARLLIEEYSEYDQAIKKVKKAQSFVKENPVFLHQIHVTLGLAYLFKGQKKKATMMLAKSMENDFAGFVSTQNVDFQLVEALLKQGVATNDCKTFLIKARTFASKQREETWVELIDRMINTFPEEK